MMNLLYLTFIIELLSIVTGFIKRSELKNRGVKFFPIFLLIQFLNILASIVYLKVFHFDNNQWMYNLFMIFDMTCFGYFFYHILDKSAYKKTVLYLLSSFYIFYLVDRFFLQSNGEYLSYSRSFMGFNLVVFSLLYFFNLFDFTKPEENLTRKADFWIVIGIFFFYLISTVILSITNYMVSLGQELYKYYHPETMKYLAIALYSFYILGYICHKPETK